MGTFVNPVVTPRVPKAKPFRTPVDVGRTLYYSDFQHNGDLETLSITAGTWAIEGGELSGEAPGGATCAVALRYSHGDVLFEVRVRDLDASGVNYWRNALRIRLSEWNNRDSLDQWNYTQTESTHLLIKRVGGTWSVESSLSEAVSGWRVMTFTARGSDLRGYRDGVLKVSDVDADVPRGQGFIFDAWADANPEHVHVDYMFIRRLD
jgi:hypothetical protein